MRGKVIAVRSFHPTLRITPACAGKSLRPFCFPFLLLGSPPRVRGKVIYDRKKKKLTGITPACAGKRPITASFSSPSRHHPRVCGEKTLSPPFKSNHGGSPPRVRGKALMLTVSGLPDRITPACAGKSSGPARKRLQKRDHPRVCGEKLSGAQG